MTPNPPLTPNQVSRSGQGPASGGTIRYITDTIAAGTTKPLLIAGTAYYLKISTGPLTITAKPAGVASDLGSGQGLILGEGQAFAYLQLENKTQNPIGYIIGVGYGNFIDTNLTLFNPSVTPVAYPTQGVANASTDLAIPDKTGTFFTDANGNGWIALARGAIYISNLDTGVTYNLLSDDKSKGLVSIPPQTDIVYSASGNFRMYNGGAAINAFVSEVYSAVPAS